MTPIQSVLITGANAGLGREAARQLGQKQGIQKIYLACRNPARAKAAQQALRAQTGRDIFEIVEMDVTDPASVRQAVDQLTSPVDAVILNAGGTGGRSPNRRTKQGATTIFATNVLGHRVLVDALLERQLVTHTVLYAGSEAARGIPKMGMQRPDLSEGSVAEFRAIADGSKFGPDGDPMQTYSYIKLFGALWMSAMARQNPHVRFVTISPGGTAGTAGFDDLPLLKRLVFKHLGGVLMPRLGMMHSVETGAKRYLDGLFNTEFKTGHFYASTVGYPTGALVDQSGLDEVLADTGKQDNAALALREFA